ncbi:DUF2141 domain-containing protein [Erythrobacter cryptus]|uniref:DUF2141 domain-containing protein n=1 Tax=Erythrobacter cryptus TaxID=196588 RepID=UPI000415A32C|nr:DUF2141 domain-containing protein [Erythrobacter cryptus]GIX20949.1 MAG: hypothetical protein KatS3mg120_2625 [Erythrobacter sp.]
MIAPASAFTLAPARALAALAALGLALGPAGAPALAQEAGYARKAMNDLSLCAPGKGPAVRVTVNGIKSSSGYLFARIYHARASDWMKSRRYIVRVEARPQPGTVVMCVPVPGPGEYALTIQHDVNGNRDTDISTDGAGMSNNPKIGRILGIPRPPGLDKTRFAVGEGITRLSITMQYL